MTRDVFINHHLNELVGLLVASFGRSDKSNHKLSDQEWAQDGKFIRDQMNRARELLGRAWDSMQPPKGGKP